MNGFEHLALFASFVFGLSACIGVYHVEGRLNEIDTRLREQIYERAAR